MKKILKFGLILIMNLFLLATISVVNAGNESFTINDKYLRTFEEYPDFFKKFKNITGAQNSTEIFGSKEKKWQGVSTKDGIALKGPDYVNYWYIEKAFDIDIAEETEKLPLGKAKLIEKKGTYYLMWKNETFFRRDSSSETFRTAGYVIHTKPAKKLGDQSQMGNIITIVPGEKEVYHYYDKYNTISMMCTNNDIIAIHGPCLEKKEKLSELNNGFAQLKPVKYWYNAIKLNESDIKKLFPSNTETNIEINKDIYMSHYIASNIRDRKTGIVTYETKTYKLYSDAKEKTSFNTTDPVSYYNIEIEVPKAKEKKKLTINYINKLNGTILEENALESGTYDSGTKISFDIKYIIESSLEIKAWAYRYTSIETNIKGINPTNEGNVTFTLNKDTTIDICYYPRIKVNLKKLDKEYNGLEQYQYSAFLEIFDDENTKFNAKTKGYFYGDTIEFPKVITDSYTVDFEDTITINNSNYEFARKIGSKLTINDQVSNIRTINEGTDHKYKIKITNDNFNRGKSNNVFNNPNNWRIDICGIYEYVPPVQIKYVVEGTTAVDIDKPYNLERYKVKDDISKNKDDIELLKEIVKIPDLKIGPDINGEKDNFKDGKLEFTGYIYEYDENENYTGKYKIEKLSDTETYIYEYDEIDNYISKYKIDKVNDEEIYLYIFDENGKYVLGGMDEIFVNGHKYIAEYSAFCTYKVKYKYVDNPIFNNQIIFNQENFNEEAQIIEQTSTNVVKKLISGLQQVEELTVQETSDEVTNKLAGLGINIKEFENLKDLIDIIIEKQNKRENPSIEEKWSIMEEIVKIKVDSNNINSNGDIAIIVGHTFESIIPNGSEYKLLKDKVLDNSQILHDYVLYNIEDNSKFNNLRQTLVYTNKKNDINIYNIKTSTEEFTKNGYEKICLQSSDKGFDIDRVNENGAIMGENVIVGIYDATLKLDVYYLGDIEEHSEYNKDVCLSKDKYDIELGHYSKYIKYDSKSEDERSTIIYLPKDLNDSNNIPYTLRNSYFLDGQSDQFHVGSEFLQRNLGSVTKNQILIVEYGRLQDTNFEIKSKETVEGKIDATDQFDVEKSIPTGENITGTVEADKLIYDIEGVRREEVKQYTINITPKYIYSWKELITNLDASNIYNFKVGEYIEKREEDILDSIELKIPKTYANCDITKADVYEFFQAYLDNETLTNKLFKNQNGDIKIEFDEAKENSIIDDNDKLNINIYIYIQGYYVKPAKVNDGIIDNNLINELKGHLNDEIKDIKAIGDSLKVNDIEIISANGKIISEEQLPNEKIKLTNSNNIQQISNGEKATNATYRYIPYNKSSADDTVDKKGTFNVNSVNIHTPVIIKGSLVNKNTSGQKKVETTQLIGGNTENHLEYGKEYTLSYDLTKKERENLFNYDEYNRITDFSKYTGKVTVEFPFDWILITDNEEIARDKGEYVLNEVVSSGKINKVSPNGTIRFKVQNEASEGEHKIKLRAYANNSNDDRKGEEERANRNPENYIAYYNINMNVVGKIYNFNVNGTNDQKLKPIIQRYKNLMIDKLPFSQYGQNLMKYNYGILLGNNFTFSLNTIGNKSKKVEIQSHLLYVPKTGATQAEEVVAFYKKGNTYVEDKGLTFTLTGNEIGGNVKEYKGTYSLPSTSVFVPKGEGINNKITRDGYIVVVFEIKSLDSGNQGHLSYQLPENETYNQWIAEGWKADDNILFPNGKSELTKEELGESPYRFVSVGIFEAKLNNGKDVAGQN